MKFNSKDINDLVEDDLLEIEKNPIFEDLFIEFKYMYNKEEDDLRKIIIQFANTESGGLVFYGVRERPLKFIGLEFNIVDKIKNHINNILATKIDPVFSPFPKFKTIKLSNGNYILCVVVTPKLKGIHGIRLSDNPSSRDFKRYEFYTRLDGNKHHMKIEEVVNLIEAKKNGIKTMEQKKLEVTISEPIMLGMNKRYIQLKAVNKGVRPITIMGYGMRSVKYGTFIEGYLKKLVRKKLAHPIPTKLSDGDAFFALYPRKYIEAMIKSHGSWEYPFELECYFKTNDGTFFSKKSINLIDLSKYAEKIKNIKFIAKKD